MLLSLCTASMRYPIIGAMTRPGLQIGGWLDASMALKRVAGVARFCESAARGPRGFPQAPLRGFKTTSAAGGGANGAVEIRRAGVTLGRGTATRPRVLLSIPRAMLSPITSKYRPQAHGLPQKSTDLLEKSQGRANMCIDWLYGALIIPTWTN